MDKINVEEHFAKQANIYEDLMMKIVPYYKQQHLIMKSLLPDIDFQKQLKVLDIGCGNGILSEMVLSKLPNVYLTGFDITKEMLVEYERKISKFTSNFNIICGDYKNDSIGKDYDIILAGMTLHHLIPEDRKNFYHIIYKSLNDTGILITNDVIIDEDANVKEQQYLLWKEFMTSNSENAEFWYNKHLTKDYPVTLSNIKNWLLNADFKVVGCYWRCYNFAVIKAEKHS